LRDFNIMNNHLLGKNTLKNQKGVTLIEMAVVVSIIALLLAVHLEAQTFTKHQNYEDYLLK